MLISSINRLIITSINAHNQRTKLPINLQRKEISLSSIEKPLSQSTGRILDRLAEFFFGKPQPPFSDVAFASLGAGSPIIQKEGEGIITHYRSESSSSSDSPVGKVLMRSTEITGGMNAFLDSLHKMHRSGFLDRCRSLIGIAESNIQEIELEITSVDNTLKEVQGSSSPDKVAVELLERTKESYLMHQEIYRDKIGILQEFLDQDASFKGHDSELN